MTPIPQSNAEVARARINALIGRGNELDRQVVDLILSTLVTVWKPMAPLTTADVLAAMGTDAATQFATHGKRLAEIWADPSRKAVLLQSCAAKSLAISASPDGSPVFAMMQPVTSHPDGTITLS